MTRATNNQQLATNNWSFVLRHLPFGILFLSFFIRVYNLTWNSFDNDEAFSWATSHRPFWQLIEESFHLQGDPHPPVYWGLLKSWMLVAGETEFAIRLLTVFFGTIYVALVYALTRRVASRGAALSAALFATLSSYLIWNSQDARMYIPSATFGLAGMFILATLLVPSLSGEVSAGGGLGRWFGAFLFTTLACYTHLGAAFLLPVQALLIAFTFLKNRSRALLGFASLALSSLVFLPFALNVWQASGGNITGHRYAPTLDQILHNATFVLWTNFAPLSLEQQWLVVIFVGAIFLVGIIFARTNFARLLLLAYYVLPLLIIVILSQRSPLFFPKMLVFMSPALMMGVGVGVTVISGWRRQLGFVSIAILLAGQLYGVNHLWRMGLQKEDWREVARYVQTHLGANDLVVVHVGHYRLPFIYYFGDRANVIAPFGARLSDTQEIETQLRDVAKYDSVWLVQSGENVADKDRVLQNWFAARYPLATEQFPMSVMVQRYLTTPTLKGLPSTANKLDAQFAFGLRLAGYEVDATKLKATEERFHPPSNWIHLTLYWLATEKISQAVALQVTVDDENGAVWGGKMDRANEVRTFYPTSQWQPNQLVREEVDVNLNPQTPTGEYKLVLRLLAPDGAALTVNGEDYLILTQVEILK